MSHAASMMIKAGCLSAVVAALILPTSATADNLKCGAGTVKVKTVCLPDYTVICGAGTQLVAGQCVPAPKQPVCGDGILDPGAGEVCDDGNTVDETQCPYGTATCTGCSSDCTQVLSLTGPYCGDGILDVEHEQCDDGNTCDEACPYGQAVCEVCNRNCNLVSATGPFCGDGITSDAELCDDGNPTCGTCSADCRASLPGGDCPPGAKCSTDVDCVSLACLAGQCGG